MSHRLLDLGLVPLGRQFRPTSASYIDSIERRYALCLPTPYRAFLARYGVSGFANPVAVRLADGTWVDVHLFLGNDPDDSRDLGESMRRLREFSLAPHLPFATDPAGNLFCLDLADPSSAAVRYIGADGQGSSRVADTFDAFVDALERLPA